LRANQNVTGLCADNISVLVSATFSVVLFHSWQAVSVRFPLL